MENFQIFWPMLVQVTMSIGILFWLAWSRVSRISKLGLAEIRKTGFPAHVNNASDNFKNQFEVPVVFYALCLFFAITNGVSQIVVVTAWVFVAARVIHAFIQLTKNVIFPYRFIAFLISALAVVFMTVLAFIHLASL